MGDYAMYIWASFGLAAVVMLVLAATSLRSLRRAVRKIDTHACSNET